MSPEKGEYDSQAYCVAAMPLITVYVASIMLVNVAVDRVLLYGSEPVLYRAVTAATLTAFVVLGALANGAPVPPFGVSTAVLNIPSAFLLVIGNELYHRYQEPGT